MDAARARARAREMIVDASSREHPKVPNRPRPNLVDKLKSLIDKYGDDLGHYGDCGGKKCLTDSEEGAGGDTVFPLVGEDGLSVSPQKGTALTPRLKIILGPRITHLSYRIPTFSRAQVHKNLPN